MKTNFTITKSLVVQCSRLKVSNIGKVTEILETGANDVWTVKPEKGKPHYIPYIEDVVKEIDIAAKKSSLIQWKDFFHDENRCPFSVSGNV